jgi:hypothetical protein
MEQHYSDCAYERGCQYVTIYLTMEDGSWRAHAFFSHIPRRACSSDSGLLLVAASRAHNDPLIIPA